MLYKLTRMKKKDKSNRGSEKIYGKVKGPYTHKSVKARIEALFLDNIGKVVTREQILEAAKSPLTGNEPENWHQRLSELRTDDGYTILSWRNRGNLKVQEYLMPNAERRAKAGKRVRPTDATWMAVLERANFSCEWNEGNEVCALKEGDIDAVGGGVSGSHLIINLPILSIRVPILMIRVSGNHYARAIRL